MSEVSIATPKAVDAGRIGRESGEKDTTTVVVNASTRSNKLHIIDRIRVMDKKEDLCSGQKRDKEWFHVMAARRDSRFHFAVDTEPVLSRVRQISTLLLTWPLLTVQYLAIDDIGLQTTLLGYGQVDRG
jgi:hypothetical protein